MRGIFAIDGGNATGLAWGIYNEKAKSLEEAMSTGIFTGSHTLNRKVRRAGKLTIVENPLSDEQQVQEAYGRFMTFKRAVVHKHLMNADQCDLVIEDFILLPGAHAGGKDGVASVRIAWGITGYQLGRAEEFAKRHKHFHISHVIWQTPSILGKYPDSILRKWGVYIPGRDHENTCLKHIAHRLNGMIK